MHDRQLAAATPVTRVLRRSTFAASPSTLFAFHMDAANLLLISPPVPRVRVVAAPNPTQKGDLQQFTLGIGRWKLEWDARITMLVPGHVIEDRQERGPFRGWRHQHQVAAASDGATLTDVIAFRLLPGPLGEFLEYWSVRPALGAMLAWRHWRTRTLLRSAGKLDSVDTSP